MYNCIILSSTQTIQNFDLNNYFTISSCMDYRISRKMDP